MEWQKEALEMVESIPLPSMIAHFAKMDAERRAKKKGLDRVTTDIAKETEKGYEKALGKESVDLLRAMARGEDVQLPDKFKADEKIKALMGWDGIILRSQDVHIVDLCRAYMEAVRDQS